MKKQIFFFIFCVLSMHGIAQQKTIISDTIIVEEQEDTTEVSNKLNYFTDSIKNVFDSAKFYNKAVLLTFGASWCLPCRQMNLYTFSDEITANLLNAKFIIVKVDVEDFDGIEFAEKYKVKKYPTYLFLNKYGKLVNTTIGFQSPAQMQQLANRYGKPL